MVSGDIGVVTKLATRWVMARRLPYRLPPPTRPYATALRVLADE